jgi:hypothetical protein
MSAWFSWVSGFLGLTIGTLDGTAVTLGGGIAALIVGIVAVGLVAAVIRAIFGRG